MDVSNCDERQQCEFCEKYFKNYKQLLKHKRKVHSICIKRGVIKCAVDNCDVSDLRSIEYYRQHLKSAHDIDVQTKVTLLFRNREDFSTWLEAEEKRTISHYIIPRGARKLKDHTYLTYLCNRSGIYKSSSRGLRRLKSQGSVKTGFYCTSDIQLKIFSTHVEAVYHKDHFGHAISVEHVPHLKEGKKSKTQYWQSSKTSLQERTSFILRTGSLSDVKFVVGSQEVEILAHKLILSMASPVLEKRFSKSEDESVIMMPEVEPSSFRKVLQYIYSDALQFANVEEATSVLAIAKKFKIHHLKTQCQNYIEQKNAESSVSTIPPAPVIFIITNAPAK